MTTDTQNALTDFDLCVAIAQQSLNSQLQTGWKQWLARSEFCEDSDPNDFSGTINIYPFNPETNKASRYGLQATLAPLQVDLNVPGGKLGQVKVTLTLGSGNVDYYSEQKEAPASQAIQNWKISFVTDLDKKSIDWETLQLIDPKAYKAADQLAQNAQLPNALFSIEYLAMEFSKVDLVSNAVVDIPAEVPQGAVTKAKEMINMLITGKAGNYMIGTVVRRSKYHGRAHLAT